MTTKEIIENITSRDTSKVWTSSCEIISLGQEKDKILPLIEYLPLIIEKTKDLEMGGAFAPNQRFIDIAIKTIKFHRDSKECSCNLYLIPLDFPDPNKEVTRGYAKILNTVKIDDQWVDYYKVECNKCKKLYKVLERESHYMWWRWQPWEENKTKL